MDEFRAGVTATLRSWTALRTAVESGWGGIHSIEKAEELRTSILQHFNIEQSNKSLLNDVIDLEDALAIYMEEEFSVTLEDNSDKQIASIIWNMYEQCKMGNYTLVQQIITNSEQATATVRNVPVSIIQNTELDDDDDDDDAMDTTSTEIPKLTPIPTIPQETIIPTSIMYNNNMSIAEYAAQPLFGAPKKLKSISEEQPVRQLGEAAPAEDPEPMVDDDGFAPVVKSKKKNRKPV